MSCVIYFSGSIEEVKPLIPTGKGRVRLAAAKYFHEGEFEAVKVIKKPRVGKVPVHFDKVLLAPGCGNAAAIRRTYADLGVPVEELAPAPEKAEKAIKAAKKPADFGWKLKSHPADYLKRNPKGARAELAREVLAKLKEE